MADYAKTKTGGINVTRLHREIEADGGIAPTLTGIAEDSAGSDGFTATFDASLSAGEETTLDGLITAHDATSDVVEDVFQIVEATADTTTTSATDTAVNSMTTTPVAGTYKVTFVGSVDHASNNASIFMSIFGGGAKVTGSERRFKRGAGQGDVTVPFTCRAKITVDGTQAIDGCWRTDGGTATMHERQISIERVD